MAESHVPNSERCLRVLQQTPDILRKLLSLATLEQLDWRPSSERWSISMVLAHLGDAEIKGFRSRFRAMLDVDRPQLPSYDQCALFGPHTQCDPYAETVSYTHLDLRAGDLQVRIHIQKAGQAAHLVDHRIHPSVNLFEIGALHGHLIRAGAELSAHCDRRRVLQEHHNAGNGRHLGPNPREDLIGGKRPLRARLQGGEHANLIAAHHEGAGVLYVGVVLHDIRDGAQVPGHRFKGNVLAREGKPKEESAVLAGDEAGGHAEE